jgi:ABC-type nitrate/sulfonate/bicarbonate transport system permease component
MFLVYYELPMLFALVGIDINRWDKLFFVVMTYGLHAAAYHTEKFRAAFSGVPAGQAEAAYSVGLSRFQAFRRIVAPQAVLTAVPNVGTATASCSSLAPTRSVRSESFPRPAGYRAAETPTAASGPDGRVMRHPSSRRSGHTPACIGPA